MNFTVENMASSTLAMVGDLYPLFTLGLVILFFLLMLRWFLVPLIKAVKMVFSPKNKRI